MTDNRNDPEHAAWKWLTRKFGEPEDRDYSADEMVDAYLAGMQAAQRKTVT